MKMSDGAQSSCTSSHERTVPHLGGLTIRECSGEMAIVLSDFEDLLPVRFLGVRSMSCRFLICNSLAMPRSRKGEGVFPYVSFTDKTIHWSDHV